MPGLTPPRGSTPWERDAWATTHPVRAGLFMGLAALVIFGGPLLAVAALDPDPQRFAIAGAMAVGCFIVSALTIWWTFHRREVGPRPENDLDMRAAAPQRFPLVIGQRLHRAGLFAAPAAVLAALTAAGGSAPWIWLPVVALSAGVGWWSATVRLRGGALIGVDGFATKVVPLAEVTAVDVEGDVVTVRTSAAEVTSFRVADAADCAAAVTALTALPGTIAAPPA